MVDYSQFEASTKSGIHADVNRIRQKDEIIKAVVRKRRNSAITCVCFVCMAGISLLKGWIPALICILIALFFLWRAVGKFSDEYLRELYEEGLLVPGMIVKTEPLTIMAIANMVAQEGAAAVNGCYCLEVKELDGAKKELFEKIPCSCFFCYEGGKYHSSFQPHPLYWGTMDQQEIGEALRQVEEDNRENSKDEWEVLKEIAQKFPDLGNGNMILLDENYVPFGKKNYMDSNYQELNQQGEPYKRGCTVAEILPDMLVVELQKYVQAGYIYIPAKDEQHKSWGELSGYRKELGERNRSIVEKYHGGVSMEELAGENCLSVYAIRKIIYQK